MTKYVIAPDVALRLAHDEVVIPDPMWTEVAENIRLAGGVPVRVAQHQLTSKARSPSQRHLSRRASSGPSMRKRVIVAATISDHAQPHDHCHRSLRIDPLCRRGSDARGA